MELLLLKYGYLLLFLGIIVEGEAFLIAGAFLANRGYFNLVTVGLVGLAASALSSQFYYVAARVRGRRWLESRFAEKSTYRKIMDWAGRHGNLLLLASRFLFGFRIVIPAACGALGMPIARFMILNVISGILWVIPLAVAGYYFGGSVNTFIRGARQSLIIVIAIASAGLALFLSWRHMRTFKTIFQNLEWSDLHNAIPFLMGLMGALNILAALMPSSERVLRYVREWLPLEVSQGSRALMLFTGVALLQVTRNLARRKELAWWVAMIGLSASLLLHVASGFDVQNSLVAALLLAYLVYFRRRFYTRTDPASLRKGLMVTPLLLLIVFSYGVTGFAATSVQFIWSEGANPVSEAIRGGILIVKPGVVPVTPYARLFLSSLQIAGWIARFYILVLILRPFISRDRLEAPKEAIERIFRECGRQSAAAFAIQADKHHLLVANGQALVAYASKGSIALACGDPLAPYDLFAAAVEGYNVHCQRHGWMPCVYLAAEERLPVYHSLKFQSLRVGEEAVIGLRNFAQDAAPARIANVRQYDRPRAADPLIDEQLEEVTEDWLDLRHMREMGFTAGHFSLEQLSRGPVFILGSRHRVDVFCAWLPYNNGRAAVLELLRQRRGTSPETLQAFLSEVMRLLGQLGFEEASLPVAAITREHIDSFGPRWEARYLVYPRGANVTKITRALTAIQSR